MLSMKPAFRKTTIVAGSVLVLATVSCASQPKKVELLPQSLSNAPLPTLDDSNDTGSEATPTAAVVTEIPDPQPTPPVDDENRSRDNSLVVVVDGTHATRRSEVTPSRLRDASRQEKQRRAAAAPVVVINDDNLEESGRGGHLTIAEPPAPTSTPRSVGGASTVGGSSGIDEEYWRARALELRLSWKEAVDTVIGLESDVGGLRQRFYAEDDPVYRDSEIKPAWDRALESLAAARGQAGDFRDRLELLLEEGRRAGALPGWLREGIEYQPPVRKTPSDDWHDVNEPVIVDEELEP